MSESSVKKRPSSEMGGRDPKRAKHAETGNGGGDGDDGARASAGAGVSSEPDLLKGVEKLYSVGAMASGDGNGMAEASVCSKW